MIHTGFITALPREVAKIYGQATSHKDSKPNVFFGVQLGHILAAHKRTHYGESQIYQERCAYDKHRKANRYRIGRGTSA